MQSPNSPRIGKHQLPTLNVFRHRRTELLQHAARRTRGSIAVLLLLLASATPASMAGGSDSRPTTVPVAATTALTERAQATATASRSLSRTAAAPAEPVTRLVTQAAAPEHKPKPVEKPSAQKPKQQNDKKNNKDKKDSKAPPAPIGGLDKRQMKHATTIVKVGKKMGLPKRAYVVALATVLQESYLRVLASPVYPESFNIPNEGSGFDHDSVGLFQQRPSSGWGTVAECMDPATSARSFYAVLQQTPGWQDVPVTVAAQTVQVSAFPDHYAKHEPLARDLVAAITG